MSFTEWDFLALLVVVLTLYWLAPGRRAQNSILLVSSYVFYGWIHPWFCLLIATSTLVDYACALGMQRSPAHRRRFLVVSLLSNLGMLGVFKYFNFFIDNIYAATATLGIQLDPVTYRILLPVGISFYTFQKLGYTIDVYRGELEARRSLLDFATFVACFPQLVAGPIERARRLLPQIEERRVWKREYALEAWPLLVRGYFKKMVVADSLAPWVEKVFLLEEPSLSVLAAGTLAFAVQILADFSAYTDIARGIARLLGLDLVENFKGPYLAVSPGDFWRRWHISFSSWIRDYLYIPLGGSRVNARWKFFWVLVASMGLSGLWHGAAWHFVAWGLYHGVLVFAYHQLGMGGRWLPSTRPRQALAIAVMFVLTLFGWALFRAQPGLAWLGSALWNWRLGLAGDELVAGLTITALALVYAAPLVLFRLQERVANFAWLRSPLNVGALVAVLLLAREGSQDFIYFQF